MKILCPYIAKYLETTYSEPSRLYVAGGRGDFIYSQEGTTQGDNCAMGFYAISTLPSIESLQNTNLYDSEVDKVTQAWFADDSSAAGNLMVYSNGGISYQILGLNLVIFLTLASVRCVKDEDMKLKAKIFQRQGIEITTKGKRHLGAVVGSQEFKKEYLEEKVNSWIEDVKLLSDIAKSEPQCAYAAMMFSVQHRWNFVQRTIPDISHYMKKSENEIYHIFLPAIIGRTISEEEHNIMALPVRYGGLEESCNFEYEALVKITRPLSEAIMKQSFYSEQDNVELFTLKQEVKRAKNELLKSTFDVVYAESSTSMKHALNTARHKGFPIGSLPCQLNGYGTA